MVPVTNFTAQRGWAALSAACQILLTAEFVKTSRLAVQVSEWAAGWVQIYKYKKINKKWNVARDPDFEDPCAKAVQMGCVSSLGFVYNSTKHTLPLPDAKKRYIKNWITNTKVPSKTSNLYECIDRDEHLQCSPPSFSLILGQLIQCVMCDVCSSSAHLQFSY